MNTIISLLNQSGASAMHFAGSMMWQASLVIGIVFLLDLLLQNRVRAALRYALWLLVLVKLVLPPSLALPTGISYWLPAKEMDVPHLAEPPVMTLVASMEPKISYGSEPASSPSPSLTVRRDGMLLIAWLCGCVGLIGVVLSRSRRLAQLVKSAAPAATEFQLLADDCARELELGRNVALRVSGGVDSPAVCGLRRPMVLLPGRLTGRLSREQLRTVLLHELLHVKRHDIWLNCVQALLQIVYWWHPLVWIANARIRRAREEAVDEGVMVVLGNQGEVYPMTLLEVAKVALRKPFSALGLVGILETRSALNQRVRRLLVRPVPPNAKLNRAGAAGVAMVGAILLPLAQSTASYLDSEESMTSGLIGGRNSTPDQPSSSGPIIEGHNREGSWAIAQADYMEYSPATRTLRARGNVVINSGVGRATAEELTLTLASGAPEIMAIEVVCSGPQPVVRRRALETMIRGLLRLELQEGDRFSHAAVETAVRRIDATGQFQDTRVRPRIESHGESTGVILKFESVCRPTLSEIEFIGNTLFDDTTLANAISSTVGGLVDPWKLWSDKELIRTKYAEAGHTNTEVKFSWSEVDLESNSSVAFEIIEAQ